MRKRIFILIIAFIITPLFADPTLAAWETRTDEKTVTVDRDEITRGDLWCTGDTVLIDGIVDGDLLVYAANLVVNGEIRGDVIGLVSNSATFSGPIGGDLRIMGGAFVPTASITLNAPVGGNISLICNAFTVNERASASGLWGTGLTMTMKGTVRGNIRYTCNEAVLGGEVTGVSTINAAQRFEVQQGANLNELHYYQKSPLVDKEATVGVIKKLLLPKTRPALAINPIIWLWFLGTLLMGFLFINFFPVKAKLWTEGLQFWPRTLIMGMALLFGIPLAVVLLTVMIIGIPMAVLLLLLWVVALLISPIPFYLYLGRMVTRLFQIERTFASGFLLVIGGIITVFLTTLPIIGWFFNTIAIAFGLGMLVQRPPVILLRQESEGPPSNL